MAKLFERAGVQPNDDGTYTIEITPRRKREKGKDGNTVEAWPETKTYTARTMDEVLQKIGAFKGEDDTAEGENDMDNFMNPDRGKETSKDDDEE